MGLGKHFGARHTTIADLSLMHICAASGVKHSLGSFQPNFTNFYQYISSVMKSCPTEITPLTHVSINPSSVTDYSLDCESDLENIADSIRLSNPQMCVFVCQSLGYKLLSGVIIQKSWKFKKTNTILHTFNNILMVVGAHYGSEHSSSYICRLPKLLSIQKIVLIENYSSTTAPIGSWVKITNHIGFGHRDSASTKGY